MRIWVALFMTLVAGGASDAPTALSAAPLALARRQLGEGYDPRHDPDLKGAPTGFTIPIRDVRMAAGAGYL